MIVAHFADNAVIRVGSTVSHTGEYWGFQNARLWLNVPHPSPPSAPSPPGDWTFVAFDVFPSDEAEWHDQGNNVFGGRQITTCGSVGTMLGGYEVFGGGTSVSYAEKTFIGLPSHTHLRVQFTFIRVDLCTQAWASMATLSPTEPRAPHIVHGGSDFARVSRDE